MIICVSITKEDLRLVDDYCMTTGLKRSTFLTRSALKEVGVHRKDIDYDYPVPNQKLKVVDEEVEVKNLSSLKNRTCVCCRPKK